MRFTALMLCATSIVAGAAADELDVSRLKLREQALVYGPTVTLGDVLCFADADEQLIAALADQPVVAEEPVPERLVIRHADISSRLRELGVNPARVLVGGALKCEVTRRVPAGATEGAAEGTPLFVEPKPEAREGATTLAQVIQQHVNNEVADLGVAEVKFERAGEELLRLTTPPWEFVVSSAGSETLGMREFRVVIRKDGQVQRRVKVFAQVSLRRTVVVAERPLNPGNFVRHEDVRTETRVFGPGEETGVAELDSVIGQQVKRFIPPDKMVSAAALTTVDLVRRSRPVTVVGASEQVQIRLTGVAQDSGGYGDTVRVRLGNSRRDRKVLRGVVTGLGTVRLIEGNL